MTQVDRIRRALPWLGSGKRQARNGSHRARAARQLYVRFVNVGDLCFDVGANVGNRTAVFLELGAHVVAVEPQQACADQLAARYRDQGRLDVVVAALGDQPGEAELLQTRYDTIATLSRKWVESVRSTGRFPFEWSETSVVPVTTLDALIAEFGVPAFCKIDVEGYEQQVLAGLSRPIPALSFEVTPEFVEAGVTCVETLTELGLTAFAFSEGESFRLGPWRDRAAITSELRALPVDGRLFGDVYAAVRPLA